MDFSEEFRREAKERDQQAFGKPRNDGILCAVSAPGSVCISACMYLSSWLRVTGAGTSMSGLQTKSKEILMENYILFNTYVCSADSGSDIKMDLS